MNPQHLSSVYFLGIGGIGMSALARYFLQGGTKVSGYDKTPTPLTDQLVREGMRIHFEDNPKKIPSDTELVIYTPAIPADHKEYNYLRKSRIRMMKRAEILGLISSSYFTIAVAGTHGKTTTSTLIAHMLRTSGIPHIAFLGGISKNYGSNFLFSSAGSKPTVCVVEADEYDRSFLKLNPDIAVVTSADPDHLDIYSTHEAMLESFADFTGKIRKGGSLVMKQGLQVLPKESEKYSVYSYSLKCEQKSGRRQRQCFDAGQMSISRGCYRFDFRTPDDVWKGLSLGLPGLFNLENAVAATAVASLAGIDRKQASKALRSYQGVVRRFDLQLKRKGFVYIDDYAHHPEELRACIEAVKEMYPGRKITGVFQPHLYTRTRDLAEEFAQSLDLLDTVILLDIYPAREKPIEGISSRIIFDRLRSRKKYLAEKTGLITLLKELKPSVLLTLGAGDIDQLVKPVRKAFGK